MRSFFVFFLLTLTQARAFTWFECRSTRSPHLHRDFLLQKHFQFTESPRCKCSVRLWKVYCRVKSVGQRPLEETEPLKMTIDCDNCDFNYTAVPSATFARYSSASNYTLIELQMSGSKLPSTLADMLAHFGHADAALLHIVLTDLRGELLAEHVSGLRAVRRIFIERAGDQKRIPFDVLQALPDLEEFSINGAQIQIDPKEADITPHPALQSLHLTSCKIEALPPAAFKGLYAITELYLDDNFITNITSEAFRGLSKLETLGLSGNPLTALPAAAFAHAPRLRRLHLNRTRLGVVPGDAFDGLTRLEEITLVYGNSSLEFGSRAFALPSLRKLIIQATPVKVLPGDLLHGATALEELKIIAARLNEIPKGFFLTLQKLQRLVLSHNNITKLDDDVFRPLKTLTLLTLAWSHIEVLQSNLFFGLHKLNAIHANDNKLKRIAVNAFDASNPITILDLDNNLLTSEELHTLDLSSALQGLKELHLRGNRLTFIVLDWQGIYSLKKLDLSKNKFTDLEEADFLFNSFNLMINLRENQITTIKFNSIKQIKKVTWIYKTWVLLDENPFRCDCELHTFIKLLYRSNHRSASRVKLDAELAQCASPPHLAGNLVQNLSPSALTCSLSSQDCPANCTCDVRPETQTLELDCDTEPPSYPDPARHEQNTTKLRLRNVRKLTLPSHVKSLNLTGLGLTIAPSFHALQNIQLLDLTQNNLIDTPLELLKTNMTMRLVGNPFACDCSHLDNIYNVKKYTARILDAENVTCSGWGSVLHLDPDKLCEIRRAAILGGTLSALGLVIAILTVLAFRFNLEIKVFLFSRGWCQAWVSEEDLGDAQYDAFVSFSQEDARWVEEQLLPKLEGEPNNFKLCVHYRDWLVGDMIPAQIATSVEQSRRTIVVLTENFLKSTWAPLEFRAANIRAQRDRRARVLVIVLGDIPECEEMDAELRAYLSTNTYLKWGDPWFWEKLRYAMPHRR